MTFINNSSLPSTSAQFENSLIMQETSQIEYSDSENDLTTFFDDPNNELFQGSLFTIETDDLVS